MNLLIVRHGESLANIHGVVAGSRDDSPLTQQGLADARAAAQQIAGRPVDSIIASPMTRTRQTAEIIQSIVAPDISIELNHDFIERDLGDATGMPLVDYFALEDAGQAIANAETPQEFYDRVGRGLEHLKTYTGDVLLVTHGGTYRMIEAVMMGRDPDDFTQSVKLKNGEVRELILTPEGYRDATNR